MGSTGQGYENLTPYLEGVCAQWRPARVDLAARLARGIGLNPGAPLRVCDLACGSGLAALIHAAANPTHELVGIDFNPTHVAAARERARSAAVGNVQFVNRAVEDALSLPFGEFDLITISGSYSWLSPDVRRAIRTFVRWHLKPGGYFGVHYMTQPGWGSIEPLWKLARDIAAPNEANPAARHAATVNLLKNLAQSAFIKNHPVAAKRLDKIADMSPEGFAHEYLTAHWRPEYHVDVARAFADEAGLVYVGDCLNLWRNAPRLSVPRGAEKLMADIADPALRETVYDYVVMSLDRHGLYHKGQIPAEKAAGDLDGVRFGSLGPFGRKASDGFATPVGKVQLGGERFAAVCALLADRSLTVREILSDPACASFGREQVLEAIGLLAVGEIIVPFVAKGAGMEASGVTKFRLTRFNADQLRRPVRKGAFALASPTLGHAMLLGQLDATFVTGLLKAGRAGMHEWLRKRFAGATMNKKDQAPLTGDALIGHILSEYEVFVRDKVPKLLELEVLLPA